MKYTSRVTSAFGVTIASIMLSSCSTTRPQFPPQSLKEPVACHKGVQPPQEGIAITAAKVLAAPSISGVWLGVTNVKMNDGERGLVFSFSGHGTFDFDFREGASDSILGITFPADAAWQLYRGFEWKGKKYGSWGLVLSRKADLSCPPGASGGCARMTRPWWRPKSIQAEDVNWSSVERALPLTQLWLDGNKITAKVTAMQFGGADGILLRVVRE